MLLLRKLHLEEKIQAQTKLQIEFQETSRVASGRYVPRKYMSHHLTIDTVNDKHIVDMRKYVKTKDDCSICFNEKVDTYTFSCCLGKTVCGPCAANLQVICPFCRRIATFTSRERYACDKDICVPNASGTYESMSSCQLLCGINTQPRRNLDPLHITHNHNTTQNKYSGRRHKNDVDDNGYMRYDCINKACVQNNIGKFRNLQDCMYNCTT